MRDGPLDAGESWSPLWMWKPFGNIVMSKTSIEDDGCTIQYYVQPLSGKNPSSTAMTDITTRGK